MDFRDTFKEVHSRHGKRLLKILDAIAGAESESQFKMLDQLLLEERIKRHEDATEMVARLPLIPGYDPNSPKGRCLHCLTLELSDVTVVHLLERYVEQLKSCRSIG